MKFQFKPFYIAKITFFLLILYSEQLQLFIDATPVTGPHLLLVALCPLPCPPDSGITVIATGSSKGQMQILDNMFALFI